MLPRRSADSTARVVAALAAVPLVWALGRFGGTEPQTLQRFFLALLPAAVLACWRLGIAGVSRRRLGAACLVGAWLLARLAMAPALGARGYVAPAAAWLVFVLAWLLAARGRGSARGVVTFLILVGLAEALVGIVQAVGGIDAIGTYARGAGRAATGTLINRNHYAALLNMALGLSLGWLVGLRRRGSARSRGEDAARTWLAVLGCSLMGIAVLLSQSRGGASALVITLTAAAVFLARERSSSPAWGVLLVTCGLGLALGVDSLLARFAAIEQPVQRLAVYADTLDLIAEAPLAGVGPGMYEWRFAAFQQLDVQRRFDHAHNDYLQSAAEWGIPAALAVWCFILWRFARTVRMARGAQDRKRTLGLGCAAAILPMLLHSLVDFSLQIPAVLAFFAAILGVSWALDPAPAARDAAGRGGRGLLAGRLALTALLLVAGWRVARLERAQAALEASPAGLERAARIEPSAPEPHFLLGLRHRDVPGVQDLEAARRDLTRAVELNPFNWRYWTELGVLHELIGESAAALGAYETALMRSPTRAPYRWRLAGFHLRQGEIDDAANHLLEAVRIDPDYLQPAVEGLLLAGADASQLAGLWPEDARHQHRLLRFAVQRWKDRGRVPEGWLAAVWHRSLAAAEPVPLGVGDAYVAALLEQGLARAARRAWVELAAAHGLVDRDYSDGRQSIWNGGFELPVSGATLGWRRPAAASAFRSPGDGRRGGAALRLDVEPGRRIAGPQQLVLLARGGQRELRCSYRTAGSTEGLRLQVVRAEGPRHELAGYGLQPTTDWRDVALAFDPGPGDRLVRVRVRGRADAAGTLWLDDFSLQ